MTCLVHIVGGPATFNPVFAPPVAKAQPAPTLCRALCFPGIPLTLRQPCLPAIAIPCSSYPTAAPLPNDWPVSLLGRHHTTVRCPACHNYVVGQPGCGSSLSHTAPPRIMATDRVLSLCPGRAWARRMRLGPRHAETELHSMPSCPLSCSTSLLPRPPLDNLLLSTPPAPQPPPPRPQHPARPPPPLPPPP